MSSLHRPGRPRTLLLALAGLLAVPIAVSPAALGRWPWPPPGRPGVRGLRAVVRPRKARASVVRMVTVAPVR